MIYVNLVVSLLQLATTIARALERSGAIKEGEQKAILDAMQKQQDDLDKAFKARAAARRELERHPERMHNDDGFKRPD